MPAASVLDQLRSIVPTSDGIVTYYPCRVRLRAGTVHEHVYLVDAELFARTWGRAPSRSVIPVTDIIAIEEAPDRLPPALANELYAAGESGMGYCVFTVVFRDGAEQAYITGNAVDFLQWPPQLGPTDAARVIPHKGRHAPHLAGAPYEWCPVPGLQRKT